MDFIKLVNRIRIESAKIRAKRYLLGWRMLGANITIGKNCQIEKNVKISFKDNTGKLILGNNCKIGRGTIIKISTDANIILNDNCMLGDNCHFESCKGAKLEIGVGTFFNDGAICVAANKIAVGDHVACGPNVTIYDHDHVVVKDERQNWEKSKTGIVNIGRDCWIAANSLILRDTSVGHNSVIGGGTVAKGDIPENSIYVMSKESKMIEIK